MAEFLGLYGMLAVENRELLFHNPTEVKEMGFMKPSSRESSSLKTLEAESSPYL